MDLLSWFQKGLTTEQYIESMNVNKDEMLHIKEQYHSFLKGEQAQALAGKQLKSIVLTADWCGDAMVNLPIFMKIAEQSNIEVRYLIRDENLELMDQFLTNGTARSIPIILLINPDGSLFAKWGPRAAKVQTIVDEYKNDVPDKEDPNFQPAFKEFLQRITALYMTDSSIWQAIEEDMFEIFIPTK